MSYDSRRETHTQMVLGMADRQGVELQELILRGELSEDRFEHAIDRCLGCTQPNACKCLLGRGEAEFRLPDYCRNGTLFKEL